ncbi:MAG TPA: glutathione transferase GstA [Stellaceae bacterium]|nr:glutathione transferase GstA [Stellaceae bacterium]
MKLYYSPGACSLSPHIVLREAGHSFELQRVDVQAKKLKPGDGDFFAVNPKGQVPVLELDDGDRLTEGPAIVQYLADQKPASGLAPANGTMPRYHLQEWLNFVTSDLHKVFAPLFRATTPDEFVKITKDNLANKFAFLDRHLATHQYLMGDSFTVADAYCFTIVNWTRFKDIDLGRWPNLKSYMDRVAARPKVQEAMKAEGLIK